MRFASLSHQRFSDSFSRFCSHFTEKRDDQTYLKNKSGHVVIRTRMSEQDCKVLEGVYMGIMKLTGVSRGKIYQEKCLKSGDSYCGYHIHWKP